MRKTFTMKDCSKDMLQTIIKQMMVVDKFINMRVGEDIIDATSYTQGHDVVKYMRVQNNALFSNPYNVEKPIRITFISGATILLLLSQFGDDGKLDVEISYNDQSDSNEYNALKVVFKSETLEVTAICADPNYDSINIKTLPDATIKTLLDVNNSQVNFDITKDTFRSIKSLGLIDKECKRFEYVIKDNVVSIRERTDYDVEDSIIYNKIIGSIDNVEDCEYLCSKNVIECINYFSDYNVKICANENLTKVVYTCNDGSVTINLIQCI